MRPILALNCLLQAEQERSEEESSVGDALALAFRCAHFCLASLILFASYSPAPLFMRQSVPMTLLVQVMYVEVFKGGFEGILVSLLLTTMGAFSYLKFSIEDFLWQTFIRHSGNMTYPSKLCQFQKSIHTLHPCPFQDFCVWNPVLPLDL